MARKIPNSPETQFKKGQSGNPKGRPPVLPELKAVIEKVLNKEKDGITALDAVIMALHRKAVKGDTIAARELLDRYYGKPKQSMELSGELNLAPLPAIVIEHR